MPKKGFTEFFAFLFVLSSIVLSYSMPQICTAAGIQNDKSPSNILDKITVFKTSLADQDNSNVAPADTQNSQNTTENSSAITTSTDNKTNTEEEVAPADEVAPSEEEVAPAEEEAAPADEAAPSEEEVAPAEETTLFQIAELNKSLSSIYFGFDKSTVRQDQRIALDNAVKILNADTKLYISLSGFTDERGTKKYNLALSTRRAEVIKNYLIAQGIDPARILIFAYGEEFPLKKGHNESAWRFNRRVDIRLWEALPTREQSVKK